MGVVAPAAASASPRPARPASNSPLRYLRLSPIDDNSGYANSESSGLGSDWAAARAAALLLREVGTAGNSRRRDGERGRERGSGVARGGRKATLRRGGAWRVGNSHLVSCSEERQRRAAGRGPAMARACRRAARRQPAPQEKEERKGRTARRKAGRRGALCFGGSPRPWEGEERRCGRTASWR